jgi:ATP-dependent DNA helicase RecG
MKVLGYVNRFSRGVNRVQKELQENGNGAAIFDFSLFTAFKVVEQISDNYFEEGFGNENIQATGDTSQKTPKKHPRNPQENQKDKAIREIILEEIKLNPKITRNELVKKLNRTTDSIKYHLLQLTKSGVIKHVGATKSGEWIMKE